MNERTALGVLSPSEDLLVVDRISKLYGGDEISAGRLAAEGASRQDVLERFNSFAAVADASFTTKAGEIFVIMGLSGSGKSTLLRCINRLIEPTCGAIRFHGEDVTAASGTRLRELRLSKISMVFQHFALLPHRTVLENVALGLKMRGVGKTERNRVASQLVAQVGLSGWEQRYPDSLSGGMKQRVGLARSLAVDPDLLLMDEAFSALDPVIRREMQQELIRLQRMMKKAIIFITHDIQEALLVGDRIAMMKDGRIVQIGSPADLILRPATDFVADFTSDADRARLLKARDIMTKRDSHGTIEIASSKPVTIVLDDRGRTVGYRSGSSTGEPLMVDFHSISPDQRLGAVLDLCTSPAPIAVTEADGSTIGAFERERLIDVLELKKADPSSPSQDKNTS
jgi:glycine betaine/proline transport system ATP-binding protein